MLPWWSMEGSQVYPALPHVDNRGNHELDFFEVTMIVSIL